MVTHHSIFITHHLSLSFHRSSLITHYSSLKTPHPVWHYHSFVITQYFSTICGPHSCTLCSFYFIYLFFFLQLPVPKLSENRISEKKRKKRRRRNPETRKKKKKKEEGRRNPATRKKETKRKKKKKRKQKEELKTEPVLMGQSTGRRAHWCTLFTEMPLNHGWWKLSDEWPFF